jgi:hypothetical protein
VPVAAAVGRDLNVRELLAACDMAAENPVRQFSIADITLS